MDRDEYELDNGITKEELKREIADILDNASLDKTSTKKVIQTLENKLGIDLKGKKKLIDELVMDYVNSMDSDEDSVEEEPPEKVVPKKAWKKQDDDEEDDEHDDSNDSDWGCRLNGHLLDGYSDDSCRSVPQESTVTTSSMRHHVHNCSRKGLILKRVAPTIPEEDEADIFGKLTAKKIRKLSEEQRDAMMIAINQLFYDRLHKRKSPPKPRMVDNSTSTPPVIQFEAKKIYRVNGIPRHLMSPNNLAAAGMPVALASSVLAPAGEPKPAVPLSNVPEPVVQEAATPKPVAAPANEKASEKKGCFNCDVM